LSIFSLRSPPPAPYSLSLHDALPISHLCGAATAQNVNGVVGPTGSDPPTADCIGEDNFADANDKPTIFPATGQVVKADTQIGARSEEHTSELQSRENLVCRLLLEKKK